jgi:hypothetical protein
MAGPGPIPFLAIHHYAERFGIKDADDFRLFMRLVQRMDGEQMRWWKETAEADKDTKKDSPDGRQR